MMSQTPTPPPPNIDVTIATAVTMNASAITLSPGRMPVAAIATAAAAAANASAITMFPGSMLVAAIGLNVGGMKPNITFAPLGVGSGQQNLDNSACLQSTTQSYLGFQFGWRVRCHSLRQHQYYHRYLGIQLRPKEEGQPFNAVPPTPGVLTLQARPGLQSTSTL